MFACLRRLPRHTADFARYHVDRPSEFGIYAALAATDLAKRIITLFRTAAIHDTRNPEVIPRGAFLPQHHVVKKFLLNREKRRASETASVIGSLTREKMAPLKRCFGTALAGKEREKKIKQK